MLQQICDNWNALYATKKDDHKAKVVKGEVDIHEPQQKGGCLTDLKFEVTEAIEFPSRRFESYTAWDSLSEKNCDGAFLIKSSDGKYDLVLIELKSKFDTKDIYEAKEQIVESLIKLNILLKSSKFFSTISIRKIVGLIVSKEPTQVDQLNWLGKMIMLEESKLGIYTCGVMLYKNHYYQADTGEGRFSNEIIGDKIEIYYHPCNDTTETIDLYNAIGAE